MHNDKMTLLWKRTLSFFIFVLCCNIDCQAFNGDDRPDLAIGVPYETVSDVYQAGIVNVLYCEATGLATGNNRYFSQDSESMEDICEEKDAFGQSSISGDFNGDGYSDLAVGIPMEDVDDILDAGGVHIIYGSAAGLVTVAPANQFITQADALVMESPEPYDYFGWALAAGDFDNDGYDDLAVGAPNDDIEDFSDAGVLIVMQGSANGIVTSSSSQKWTQNTGSVEEEVGKSDKFSYALSAADINGDGYDDLVIGAPGEGVRASERYEGCIHVLFGSMIGLSDVNNQCLWQGKDDLILDQPDYDDNFGYVVVTSDFNGDGYADIAVTTYNEGIDFGPEESIQEAGMVQVLYGGAFGVSTMNDSAFHQAAENEPRTPDKFGKTLGAGDINGDGYSDLIIGAPHDELGSITKCGSFFVLWGSIDGITDHDAEWHYQGDGVIPDNAEDYEYFPSALVCADFNQDGFWDLAAGCDTESFGSPELLLAGSVYIIRGAPNGLIASGAQTWNQDTEDVAGSAEDYDHFGYSLAVSAPRKTPFKCNETAVTIWMPGTNFHPGELCGCVAKVCNAKNSPLSEYPLFVILEIAGAYYFAPSFSSYDNYLEQHSSFPAGETEVIVIPAFPWPDGAGSFNGCTWYGALTDPDITELYGDMDTWSFGWSE